MTSILRTGTLLGVFLLGATISVVLAVSKPSPPIFLKSAMFSGVLHAARHHRQANAVLVYLDTHARHLELLLGTSVSQRPIVHFHDRRTFPLTQPGVAGYYRDGETHLCLDRLPGRYQGDDDILKVAVHEYVHFLISTTCQNTPAWLDEGLAVYLSGQHLVALPQDGRRYVSDITGLLEIDFAGDKVRAHIQAGLVVGYLFEVFGVRQLRQFLAILDGGHGMHEALAMAYALTEQELLQRAARHYSPR